MTDPLTPLHALLDALPASGPVLPVFLRDDDAGWDDARLLQLLDTTGATGVPIDLAAIPMAVTPGLAATLNQRLAAAPGLLGLHQHGCRHDNHQREGRKGEFGSDRDAAAQRADLVQGRERLQQHFGDRLDAIFTPPWNRCAPYTPALLAALGYAALSRDTTAPPQTALPELPVALDWTRHHRSGGAAAVAQALADALSNALATQAASGAGPTAGTALGLMLHHAVMDPGEFTLLAQVLHRLADHPRLQGRPMRALLPPARPSTARPTTA